VLIEHLPKLILHAGNWHFRILKFSNNTGGTVMLEKRIFLPAVFFMSLTVLFGCADPLVLGGLGRTAPVAFSSTGIGQGDSAWLARYDDVVQATLHAAQVLALEVEKKEIGDDRSVFQFIDGTGKTLDARIERRTETVTYAHFSVGLFGSRTVGQLLVRQIIFELNKEGKFLRDMVPVEAD